MMIVSALFEWYLFKRVLNTLRDRPVPLQESSAQLQLGLIVGTY